MKKATAKNLCPICGGTKKAGKTIYSVELGSGVVVVRNVAATVCNQCGEEWIDAQTARRLEQVVEEARKKHHQVEVLAL